MSFLTRYRDESIWDRRGVLAFALAPLAPVLLYSVFTSENFLGSLMFSALLAYGHLLVLGLPLAAVVNHYRKVSLLTSSVGGTLVGLLPWAVFMSYSMLRSPAHIGGDAVVAMFFSFGFFSGMGLTAGFAWWWIACFRPGSGA